MQETEGITHTYETSLDNFIQTNLQRWQTELSELCAVQTVTAQSQFEPLLKSTRLVEIVEKALADRALETTKWETATTSQPVVFGKMAKQADAPTLLFYNHYDVQPVEPLAKWESNPLLLTEREGRWWAQGVADNKGSLIARLAALETYQAIFGELPINIKFVVEGEHEVGSPHLEQVIAANKAELAADACIWEFGQYTKDGAPILHLGSKGILSVELISRTLNQDAHSSLAGILPSAAWKLIWALSSINDIKDGIQISGFYDDIAVPTKEDSLFLSANRKQYTEHLNERLAHFGIEEYMAGLQGLPLLITEFFTPTSNVSGIESGYVGPGSKTVLPAYASVRLDFRLVPDQDPLIILEHLKEYLSDYRFQDIEVRLNGAALKPARTSPSDPFVQLASRTALEANGQEALLIPLSPSSGPMYIFKERLNNLPIVGAGVCYEGSNQHAPNENIRIEDFVRHIKFIVQLIRNLVEFKGSDNNFNNEELAIFGSEIPDDMMLEPFGLDSSNGSPFVSSSEAEVVVAAPKPQAKVKMRRNRKRAGKSKS